MWYNITMPYKDKEIARIKSREYEKKDRISNPDKYRIRARKKYLKHREKRLAYAKAYREKYPERIKEANRKSKSINRDYYLERRKELRKQKPKEFFLKENLKAKLRRIKNRRDVINHYGGKCSCCGENEFAFLTVEHVNGGGTKHRKIVGAAGMIGYIKRNNYPSEFDILCYNCNCSKSITKICPHKILN